MSVETNPSERNHPWMSFGERVRAARKYRRMTQAELARRLLMPERSITRYESGENQPTAPVIVEFAKALSVSSDWLLEIDELGLARFLDLPSDLLPGWRSDSGEDATGARKDRQK